MIWVTPIARPALLAVVLAAPLAGCGASASSSIRGPASSPSAVSDPQSGGAADAIERFIGREHGIAVRRVRVLDAGDLIGATIAAHALPSPLDPDREARLARSGVRLALVPIDAIDALMARLGPPALDSESWHGEATTWRPLADADLRGGMQVVAVDGRVRRLADGRVRLDFRGWTLMTEDGPRTQIELLPVFDRSRRTSIDRSLGRGGFDGERWRGLRVDLELPPDVACVLTTDRAGATWTADDAADGAVASASAPPRDRGWMPGADPSGLTEDELGVVPSPVGTGPSVAAPRTLGELLLAVPTVPRTRDLILILPRVPAAAREVSS